MAIRKAPNNGSTHAGAQGGRDLISLSLAPVRQGLSLYAEINRSILETFFRFIPGGMSPFGAVSERNGLQSAAVEPVTAAETRSSKRPAKPPAVKRSTAAKRPAATKAVAGKRPATTKAVATKAVATKRPAATKGVATKRPAAPPAPRRAKSAAPKRAGKAAPKPAAKSARVKPSAAKKVASSRPRGARASAGKKA